MMAYKRTADRPVEVQLPITPMLDMAFQLMFFFLATFNPSSVKEGQMEMAFSSRSDRAAQKAQDVDPKSEPNKESLDISSECSVNIRGFRDAVNRGEVSALTFGTAAGEEEIRGTGPDPKEQRKGRDAQLKEKLAGVKPAAGEGKVATVRVSADSNVRWENVMQIMDVCYKVGFQVNFVKPPDLGNAGP